MRVVIHIDTLVVNGVDRFDEEAFKAALKQQLQAQIEAHGWPVDWGSSADVPSLSAAIPRENDDAASVGGQVAGLLTGETRS